MSFEPQSFEPQSPLPSVEPAYRGLGRYGRQNVAVCVAQLVAWAALLTAIDRSPSPWLTLPLVFAFCAVMQGVFTLMHEYFHKNAHRSPAANYVIGVVGALLFGTSATLHRINHWGHHVRNRTSAERGEFVHPGESYGGKVLLYYFATMGGLWVSGILFPIASLLIPYRSVTWLRAKAEFNTYSAAFAQFGPRDWARMRVEALLLICFWGAIIGWGPWRWQTLAMAYAAFAYHWSVLQWIYHLRTPIDVIEGAYNLRVPTPVGQLWLNFNCNLTHHRHPALPWQELPAHTDWKESQPLWYRYGLMWRPPVPFPDEYSSLEKRYF
ncbi:MAG: fatty acid desaturase [Pseudomonadota bacterium]|nr:fatty acid desaturase [Pseudomonadota bacterium]